ncbi:unnamed protein product, partial [Linum tenue]
SGRRRSWSAVEVILSYSDSDGTPVRPVFCLNVKNGTDVHKFEAIEDCFILDFDPYDQPASDQKLNSELGTFGVLNLCSRWLVEIIPMLGISVLSFHSTRLHTRNTAPGVTATFEILPAVNQARILPAPRSRERRIGLHTSFSTARTPTAE